VTHTLVIVYLRLSAPCLGFYVDVRLCDLGGRWLAVAVIAGEYEIGVGTTVRMALTGSLVSMGPDATALLLSDPQLKVLERHR
jgi:hypothetical protein